MRAAPEDIAFVPNATFGVNAVLRSLDLSPGDELLTTDHVYPACRKALAYVASRTGARLVEARVPFPLASEDDVAGPVLAAVTPRTRLALLDHVTSPTALVFPVARLVAELGGRGVDTLVDGAHALGMEPLELTRLGAAYYTANAHKWLCAPKGAAFLHVRKDRQKSLHPAVISHGYEPGADTPRFKEEFDWTGTADPTAALTIPFCLEYLGGLVPGGWSALMQKNRDLALRAREIFLERFGGEAACPAGMLGSMAAFSLPTPSKKSPVFGLDRVALCDWVRACGIESWFHPSPSDGAMLVRGIGIFRTPAIVAARAGTPALFYGAWTLGGLVALVGALVFAEIGSRHPRAGGYYRVVADCYSPALAFMLNWAQTIMQGAGAAGVAFIGGEYLVGLLLPPEGRTARAVFLAAMALMLALLVLNALGIRSGARTQNILSMAKIALLAGLAAAALALTPAAPRAESAAPAHPFLALAAALVPVFYTCGGYHMTMNLGADVKDARRRFPLAVVAGMLVVVALYLLANFAYERTLGLGGVAASKLVAAALARASLGAAGEAFVSAAIFLSAAGFVNATILQMPRAYLAMAEDGVLPRAFARIDPGTQVQPAGLALFAATMLVPAFLLGSFEKLLDYVIFTDAVTLVVVASTLFVLRRLAPGDGAVGAAFRVPGGALLPAAYLLALSLVAANIAFTAPRLALAGAAILLTGGPLFVLGRRLTGREG